MLLVFGRANEVNCGLWNGSSIQSGIKDWDRAGPLVGIVQPLRYSVIYNGKGEVVFFSPECASFQESVHGIHSAGVLSAVEQMKCIFGLTAAAWTHV